MGGGKPLTDGRYRRVATTKHNFGQHVSLYYCILVHLTCVLQTGFLLLFVQFRQAGNGVDLAEICSGPNAPADLCGIATSNSDNDSDVDVDAGAPDVDTDTPVAQSVAAAALVGLLLFLLAAPIAAPGAVVAAPLPGTPGGGGPVPPLGAAAPPPPPSVAEALALVPPGLVPVAIFPPYATPRTL